jgi:ADP-heptose:LPS heptosyltransferase
MTKFLIIRFSSIGDIVLTTPVVRCLKEQIKDSEVHYLTKPSFASLLENNPYIDKMLLLKPSLSDTIKEINQESYQYIIDLHRNLRTFIIKSRTQVLSFTFPKLNLEKWLLVNLKINRLPDIHIVDRYFEAVKLFDVTNDGKGLDVFIDPNNEVNPTTINPSISEGYIVVVVGAKHFTKQIPTHILATIIDELNYPVVLIGDRNDEIKANEIIAKCRNKKIFNVCGKFSLLQSSSIVKNARVVLTGDTGFMHIAAAFNTKIVTVWGNTVPQFGMYPYTSKEFYSIHEVNNLPCRPCSKLGYEKCPKKHFNCMNQQNVDDIIKQIKQFYE